MAEITAKDAVALLDLMEGAGATVWVDGGWPHTRYDWDVDDVRDVAVIAERFGIEAPTDPSKEGS